jgi:hypothetical protein
MGCARAPITCSEDERQFAVFTRKPMIEQLRSLFEMLVAELPDGTAKVRFYRVPRGDGSVIEVLPANQKSASFAVHVDAGVEYVDFRFGRIGTWELPGEGRNHEARAEQLVQEVEQMARAVIAGNCDETRGLFSLTSRVYVAGYTYKVADLPMLPIPPFGTRRYAPYSSTPTVT